jgi:hypothetical protein
MSSFLSKINPTTKSVQREYVEKRKRALFANDPAKTERVRKKIEAVMAKNGVAGDWHDTYLRIHRTLQSRDLTINFEAGNWFKTENKYSTYGQMYERSVGSDGKMVLTDSDAKNPAVARAVADDLVTIPEEWANAHPFSQRKRLHRAMNVSGASLELFSTHRTIANPGMAPKMKGDKDSGYTTKNSDFKPKARQVFAALNYGGRLHGSCTYYGHSHIVLNPELKTDAFFYPSDTFYIAHKGASTQASLNTIGALTEHMSMSMMDLIWRSCYQNLLLPDTDSGDELVEAHIFRKLKVAEDVQMMVLSRQRKSSEQPWSNAEWTHIVGNARKWCQRNSVRLVFASP